MQHGGFQTSPQRMRRRLGSIGLRSETASNRSEKRQEKIPIRIGAKNDNFGRFPRRAKNASCKVIGTLRYLDPRVTHGVSNLAEYVQRVRG
jgi:hypothetical protein